MNRISRYLGRSLGWKLMISYLVVIIVGAVTLYVAAETVIPTAFHRHMFGMQQMMGRQMGVEMQSSLFTNFRLAVTEALLWAIIMAVGCAGLVSLFISRRVVIPIRQMMEASQRIATGQYQERVDMMSEDELGQLARSFNRMAHTLEQTESMRRDLIANVAHELRTPLSGIKGYMGGLIDGVIPATPETYRQVYREADRLERLVVDLQELSGVEAGAFELDNQPLPLIPLIEQIATRLQPQFESKNVRLVLDLPDELPPVHGDEDRISQVLVNLIGNALHYTESGGRVTVQATSDHKKVTLLIQDTGIGISSEHLPHLFTRFYRVDKSRSRVGGGSGIGLTIAKHLVEAHQGQIWADSKGLGQGSEFGFSLPRA